MQFFKVWSCVISRRVVQSKQTCVCVSQSPLNIVIDSDSPFKETLLQMDWTKMDFLAAYFCVKVKLLSKAFHRNVVELHANFLKGFFFCRLATNSGKKN